MLVLISLALMYAATYCFYKAVYNFYLFRDGIRATATILSIEQIVEQSENGEYISYWLHLELPKYHGLKLGKKYQKSVDPNRYAVGEELEIFQKKDFPTEVLIIKEMKFYDYPRIALTIGILLFLLSYASCNVGLS